MEEKVKYWEPKLWEELRSSEPHSVCNRSSAGYNESGFYSVKSMDKDVRIFLKEEKIEMEDDYLRDNPDFQLLIISYLLYAQNIEPLGKWISEKDVKGGSLFFRGPHALPSIPLERTFGDNGELFRDKAQALGGQKQEFGDISMSFTVLPRISMTIVIWLKDEEFPARATFMFDSTIDSHLPLDVISAMVQSVTGKLLSL